MTKLLNTTKNLKARGAPGLDKIAPPFLKNLGPSAQRVLLEIFNRSWSRARCSQDWRRADIVPILKKGKPAGDISSYRPVSFAKTFERMIAARLQHLAESNG